MATHQELSKCELWWLSIVVANSGLFQQPVELFLTSLKGHHVKLAVGIWEKDVRSIELHYATFIEYLEKKYHTLNYR